MFGRAPNKFYEVCHFHMYRIKEKLKTELKTLLLCCLIYINAETYQNYVVHFCGFCGMYFFSRGGLIAPRSTFLLSQTSSGQSLADFVTSWKETKRQTKEN